MSNKPFFSGRIPQELLDQVEEHAKNTGKSKTDILVEALSAYLEFPIISRNSINNDLEARIVKLEEKLENINISTRVEVNNKNNEQTQLSLLSDENGNNFTVENDKQAIENNKNDSEWILIGEMFIEQIVRLPHFRELGDKEIDRLKSKVKETRRKTSQEVNIEPYLIRRVAKEPEGKGRISYSVYEKQ